MKFLEIKPAHEVDIDLVEPMDDFSVAALLDRYKQDSVAMYRLRSALLQTGDRDMHNKTDQEVLLASDQKLKNGQLKVQKDISPCTSKLFNFIPLFSKMAQTLETRAEFLMALALQESGWDLSHVYETNPSSKGKPLNNLFGLTNAGGDNLSFPSVEASGDYYIEKWGTYVKKSKTIDDFVNNLLGTPGHQWNSHRNYRISILGGIYVEDDRSAGIKRGQHTIGTYKSVMKWLTRCGRAFPK